MSAQPKEAHLDGIAQDGTVSLGGEWPQPAFGRLLRTAITRHRHIGQRSSHGA